MTTTTTLNQINRRWLGNITDPELVFCTLIGIVGLNAPQAYKIAFNKHNISPSTASSNASRIVNDVNIQRALWKIYELYNNRKIGFKESILKGNNPNFSSTENTGCRDFNLRHRDNAFNYIV